MFAFLLKELEEIPQWRDLGEPITEAEVAAHEARQGFRLPHEYREFLKQVSNGFAFGEWGFRVLALPLPDYTPHFLTPPGGLVVLACNDFRGVLCMDPTTAETYEWSCDWKDATGEPEAPKPRGFLDWVDNQFTMFSRMEYNTSWALRGRDLL